MSVRADLGQEHLNHIGFVHGGLYAKMLDVALAMTVIFWPEADNLLRGIPMSLTVQCMPCFRV